MQITIVLDGSEGAQQLRRISNAVLALSGAASVQSIENNVHIVPPPATVLVNEVKGAGGAISTDDMPDTGAPAVPPATPVSAVPLPPPVPPAPSVAAVDLFPTAPEVPPAGVPAPPTVAAPPVPTDTASAAPPAPATTSNPAAGVELDKNGLPWDARIHSGSREKIKDGTWRQRRNLPDGERERVEAELRILMALPANVTVGDGPTSAVPLPPPVPPAVPAAPAVEQATITESPATVATVPVTVSGGDVPNAPPAPPSSAPAIAAIPMPPVPPAPTAAAPSAPVTGANPFAALMTKITSEVTAKRLSEAQVHAALAEHGLQPSQIVSLSARHDLAEIISKRLDQFLAGGA